MAEIGKRQMERFNLSVPAVITLKGDGNLSLKPTATLKTKNICAGGAFMITDEPLKIGVEVDVELHLAFFTGNVERECHSNVRISGSIIRSESSGMVVKFDDKYQITPVPKDMEIRS